MAELFDEEAISLYAAERERNIVQIALEASLASLNDRKKDINLIFDTSKAKAAWEQVMIILGSEIEEAVRGRMIVPEYSQKGSAKQIIYVFIGTHWEITQIQIYYDFIKEACRRIGLSEVYVQNQDYMNKVFENVAFRVSKHISTVQPHDGVWINLMNGTIEISPSPALPEPLPSPPLMGGRSLTPSPSPPLDIPQGWRFARRAEEGEGSPSGERDSDSAGADRKANLPNTPPLRGELEGGSLIRFREHRSSDFFLYCLPYCYDPQAECPRWLQFLDEVLPEKESQTLLGEYIGYCFTQNLRLEKMAVFYGGGANGKSVCLDVIKHLIGRNNVSEATLNSITNDPEARALLQNKLVNISSEAGKNINPAILKMLISGEAVEMRILYVGTKLLYNPPKLITSYNELPPAENTHGYRRRWILFPFNKTIADNRQDPALAGKLCTELPGILNWVLRHLSELVMRVNRNIGEDFTRSEACVDALNEYFNSTNSASMFLEECCNIVDVNNVMRLKELYDHYQLYCRCTGITKPVILKNFKKIIADWGVEITAYNKVMYVNVQVDTSVYT